MVRADPAAGNKGAECAAWCRGDGATPPPTQQASATEPCCASSSRRARSRRAPSSCFEAADLADRSGVRRLLPSDDRRSPHRRGRGPATPGDPRVRGRAASSTSGITGRDWIEESGADVVSPRRAALLEGVESPGQHRDRRPRTTHRSERVDDLPIEAFGCRPSIPSSPVASSRSTASGRRLSFSYGATEAKVGLEIADAVVDLHRDGTAPCGATVCGSSTRSSRHYTELIANPRAYDDAAKRHAMQQIHTLLQGTLEARGKVLVKLNVGAADLDAVIALLPAMKSPTVSKLFGARTPTRSRPSSPRTSINTSDPGPQGRRGQSTSSSSRCRRSSTEAPMNGTVATFDEAVGWGTMSRRRRRTIYGFHCTAIADGSRTIEVGTAVAFDVVAGPPRSWEARVSSDRRPERRGPARRPVAAAPDRPRAGLRARPAGRPGLRRGRRRRRWPAVPRPGCGGLHREVERGQLEEPVGVVGDDDLDRRFRQLRWSSAIWAAISSWRRLPVKVLR